MKEGFDDYLSKPVNPDELEAILERNLPKEMMSYEMTKDKQLDEISEEVGEDNFSQKRT